MNSHPKGMIALVISATLYGLFGVFSREIGFQVPFFYQQWIRNLFTLVMLVIAIFITKSWKKINSSDYKWFFLQNLCGFISFVGIYLGFIYLDFSTNYFISYATSTIGGYIAGNILFGEKLDRKKVWSLILAIIGVYLTYQAVFSFTILPYLLISAVGGLATAGWFAFSKKISNIYSNLQINVVGSVFMTILSFMISILRSEQWLFPIFNKVWIMIFLFGIFFLLNSFLIIYGFSKVEVQKGSLIMLLDIVAGIFFGYLFYAEKITGIQMIGGLLILASMILPNINTNLHTRNTD